MKKTYLIIGCIISVLILCLLCAMTVFAIYKIRDSFTGYRPSFEYADAELYVNDDNMLVLYLKLEDGILPSGGNHGDITIINANTVNYKPLIKKTTINPKYYDYVSPKTMYTFNSYVEVPLPDTSRIPECVGVYDDKTPVQLDVIYSADASRTPSDAWMCEHFDFSRELQ